MPMGNWFIFLFGRLVKIVAHVVKLLSYVFHFLFPNKRFTLPKHSAPWIKSRKPSKIPRTIWQTNYTDRLTLPLYVNYLFNRLMAPTYEYRFMITEDRAEFIKREYPPDIYETYSKITIGAAQADFWRVLVVQKLGGVYMDIDGHLVWFLHRIIKPNDDELFMTIRGGDVSNYFFASKPDSPYLDQMTRDIRHNIDTRGVGGVWDTTGPGVFIRTLAGADVNTISYQHSCLQGNFTNEYFQYVDKPEGKWIHQHNPGDA